MIDLESEDDMNEAEIKELLGVEEAKVRVNNLDYQMDFGSVVIEVAISLN